MKKTIHYLLILAVLYLHLSVLHAAEGTSLSRNGSAQGQNKDNECDIIYRIPLGTIVEAIIETGVDCSVAVERPLGKNAMLLKVCNLEHSELPNCIKKVLKNTRIIVSASGEIASERVYAESGKMSVVRENGSLAEVDLKVSILDKDNYEGLKGVVLDNSKKTRAQPYIKDIVPGIIENIHKIQSQQFSLDAIRALNVLVKAYIGYMEQLQPCIQIEKGRSVKVIFLKTVEIHEKDFRNQN